MRARQP
jgi:four helix bundle protein